MVNMNRGNKLKIRKLYQIGIPINEIAELFNITPNEVIRLCEGVKGNDNSRKNA